MKDNRKNVYYLRKRQSTGRRLLMFQRAVKYGVSNFVRNGWLSLAAIAVMTLTLLTVFMAAAATVALNDTVENTKVEKLDLSFYVRPDTPESVLSDLKKDLESSDNVAYVDIYSREENRDRLEQMSQIDDETRALLEEDGIKIEDILPTTLGIHVKDITKIDDLRETVDGDNSPYKAYQHPDSYDKQFFHGENQKTVQNMSNLANTVQLVGFVLGGVFLLITILVIFNTIRLAIFARRDEIEMEKLIGAERSYVRGPFLIEAELYGIISALLALTLGYIMLLNFLPAIWTGESTGGISSAMLNQILIGWSPLVILAMVAVGILIGNLSARLAVKKYLHY